MNSAEYIKLEEEYGAHNYHPLDVVIERAEGCWVYDVDGKKYLDVQDDSIATAGKVGLWTKADSVTYFDDLKVVAK